ncbi:MAG TPA: hypothetical protein VFI93_10910 [Rhizomicrobium sp.]|nr:hypothetical protein [Rhizomicrobium sp.]
MKYGIDYRILQKGATTPVDNTTMHRPVDVEVDDGHFALIPNVGDYVDMVGENDFRHINVKGRVKTRVFDYKLNYCYVYILVEETDEDWSKFGR